jgi:dipeptidase E
VRRVDVLVRGRITASFGRRLRALEDGLGLLPGSNFPHYLTRRETYLRAIEDGLVDGIAAEDGVALHFVEHRLAAVVASREGRRAYRVGVSGGRVVEAPLRPVVLDAQARALARAQHASAGQMAPAALAAVP